ncbi:hypothetical protein [Longitalea arenae]|uniref:hypothetical protein n=1 Tax=Longitalea arenae TaxID=2812558 RepID=UPI00196708CD|nr:hypothetical protein [Longitalea arenae]
MKIPWVFDGLKIVNIPPGCSLATLVALCGISTSANQLIVISTLAQLVPLCGISTLANYQIAPFNKPITPAANRFLHRNLNVALIVSIIH